MKHFQDFVRSGASFEERVGQPDSFETSVGCIAIGFAFLEETARNVILFLSYTDPTLGRILTAELSFKQKLDVIGALMRHYIASLPAPTMQETLEVCEELLTLCHRAEKLRNTYLHSIYVGNLRVKESAKSSRGYRLVKETFDPGLLLDVADFIIYAGGELETLPILLNLADLVSGSPDMVEYKRGESTVAVFRTGTHSLGGTTNS